MVVDGQCIGTCTDSMIMSQIKVQAGLYMDLCINMLADSEVAYQVSEVQGLSPHPLPAAAARRGVPTGGRSPER